MNSDNFSNINDEIHSQIGKVLGYAPVVYYSAYDLDEDHNPINNLNDVAIKGPCRIKYDMHWGEISPISHVMEDPTWLEVACWADVAIRLSGDLHHVFLENVHQSKEDPELYLLSTGS